MSLKLYAQLLRCLLLRSWVVLRMVNSSIWLLTKLVSQWSWHVWFLSCTSQKRSFLLLTTCNFLQQWWAKMQIKPNIVAVCLSGSSSAAYLTSCWVFSIEWKQPSDSLAVINFMRVELLTLKQSQQGKWINDY